MRLSRPRVLLRAALLAVGGAFMLWRAWEARGAAGEATGGEASLLTWVARVEALMGALALVAAGVALLALRRRQRTRTLHLSDLPPPPRSPGGEG